MADAVFYYDFNSPYAYLAAERIDELVPGAEWRPIAFAILLNQLGELDKRLTNLNTAPIVEEITPDGAVLSYRGRRFLLPRL